MNGAHCSGPTPMTVGTRSCAQRELLGRFRPGITFIKLPCANVQRFDGHGVLQWTVLAAECRLTATPLIIIFGHIAAPQPILSNKGAFQTLATCIIPQFSLPESHKTAVRAVPSSLCTPAPPPVCLMLRHRPAGGVHGQMA